MVRNNIKKLKSSSRCQSYQNLSRVIAICATRKNCKSLQKFKDWLIDLPLQVIFVLTKVPPVYHLEVETLHTC